MRNRNCHQLTVHRQFKCYPRTSGIRQCAGNHQYITFYSPRFRNRNTIFVFCHICPVTDLLHCYRCIASRCQIQRSSLNNICILYSNLSHLACIRIILSAKDKFDLRISMPHSKFNALTGRSTVHCLIGCIYQIDFSIVNLRDQGNSLFSG